MLQMSEEEQTHLYRIYESIWRNMQRENDLINQRLGWAIFTSGGIFAATTILANITVNANWEPFLIAPLYLAMAVLSFVALRFSGLAKKGVLAAQARRRVEQRAVEDPLVQLTDRALRLLPGAQQCVGVRPLR